MVQRGERAVHVTQEWHLHHTPEVGGIGLVHRVRRGHAPVASVVIEQRAELAGGVKARGWPPVDTPSRVTSAADWPSDNSAWFPDWRRHRSGPVFGGLVRELEHVGKRLGDVDAG